MLDDGRFVTFFGFVVVFVNFLFKASTAMTPKAHTKTYPKALVHYSKGYFAIN